MDIVLCDVDMSAAPLDSKFEMTVRDASKKGDIRVLINNAGRGHNIPVTFADTTDEEMEGIMALNIGGVIHATKAVLPFMLSDKYLPTPWH